MSSTNDILKVAYKVLFTLQFELEGYNDIVNSSLKILPDAPTLALFSTYKMLPKRRYGNNALLIKTNAEGVGKGKPEIEIKNNEAFRFQIKMDTGFLSATHLAAYNFTDTVLYATNAANNVVDGNLLLSLPLGIYNASASYTEGHLVQSAGKYYRAIQASSSGNVHGIAEAAYWKEIIKPAYISQADLKLRSTLLSPADLDTIMVLEIRHTPALSADYRLLDAAFKCREVLYKIRLLM